jgi:acyl-CoA synthetase (AMP-forming)/AMP-acid ligase II
MAERPTNWPSATSTLLPQHLAHLATLYPDVVYAEVPRTPDSFEYVPITYRQLNNAVNAFAWWVKSTIGLPVKADEFPTMVYMGPNDLRYAILALGAVKAGYKVLFPTPRYNAEGLSILLQKLESKIMLTPSTPFPVVNGILEKRDMDVYQVPELFILLNQRPREFPYTKTFEHAKTEPLVVLHTSGTTGFPKPIVWSHDWAHSFAEGNALQSPEGTEPMLGRQFFRRGTRMLTLMPAFHVCRNLLHLFNMFKTDQRQFNRLQDL